MKRFILISCLWVAWLGRGRAAPPLIVATKDAPPFSMKTEAGEWDGMAIRLWRSIAADLKLTYEFREMSLEEMLHAVETGTANVGVAALTITAEREAVLDFTHPFYSSGLGIATTLGATRPRWLLVLQGLFSWTFLQAVLALVGVLLVAAVGVWLFERKHNADQFGGPGLRGLGHSFWWSAVTMTTVGYGDKSPQTIGGRLVALIWMFTSVIVISSFTATIASSLTLSQFHSLIRGPDDLRRVRVGTVPGTTSDEYLRSQGINPILAESLPAALDQLAAGQVAAVVYDAPLLLYRVNQQFAGRLQVLPQTFARQNYAFALPTGSPLREPINKALLKKLSEPQWEEIRLRYLGR